MREYPSNLKIIKNDLFAMISTAVPIVSWLLFFALWYFKEIPGRRGNEPLTFQEDGSFILIASLVLTAIGVFFLWRRFQDVKQYFEEGIDLTGTIVEVRFIKDRGSVVCSYEYENNTYTGKTRVHKTKETKALSPGDKVNLLCRKENPKKIILKDLFLAV